MKKLTALLGCFVLMLAAGTAFASSGPGGYPSGPIQVVVTFSAGAATDFQARIATQPAQKYFGQPMVIQNMPGAGGMTGWNWVIDRGSRDGLTMTTYNMPHTVAQSLVQAASNFTVESWQPIANFGSDPAVLVVPVGSNIQNVADFVSFAKANPRRLTVNGAGLFVGHHVATLQLQQAADIQVTYVPEQGAADALASLYGNAVMAGFTNLSDASRATDRLRILAIANKDRHPLLPNTPTFLELGINVDDSSSNFRGLAFPVGVPEEIVAWASEQAVKMFNDPEVVNRMAETNSPMLIMNRKEATELFHRQREALIKLFDAQPDITVRADRRI